MLIGYIGPLEVGIYYLLLLVSALVPDLAYFSASRRLILSVESL